MSHLGPEVAAYVDGQLSAAQGEDARSHLEGCECCRHAVRQQILLKDRMRDTQTPAPPQSMLANLSRLQDRDFCAEAHRSDAYGARLRRSRLSGSRIGQSPPVRIVVAFLSTAAVLVATAYAVGAPAEERADLVSPPIDDYVAVFWAQARSSSPEQPATVPSDLTTARTVSQTSLAQLDNSGWPSSARLGPFFHRVDAAVVGPDDALMVTYLDGRHTLKMFEQHGSLELSSLDRFRPAKLDGSLVWVRDGDPTVIAWDADGIVFTLVTDAQVNQLDGAVPKIGDNVPTESHFERIGGGFTQMAAWLGAA